MCSSGGLQLESCSKMTQDTPHSPRIACAARDGLAASLDGQVSPTTDLSHL